MLKNYAYMHIGIYMHARIHNRYTHIHTFKATKDIAAGQELFIRYGSAHWFQSKSIYHTGADYASTMWRPDLRPLPCRQNIDIYTGPDGRHSFGVVDTIPADTVVDISLCVDVSPSVVDQLPFLWDFVFIGLTSQTVCVCVCVCVYARMQKSVGNRYTHAKKYLCQIPQVCIPLSYTEQIPTTPNPDLANVRVSFYTLEKKVR